MFLVAAISMLVMLVLLFSYQNIVGAIARYSYDTVDEHRFTLRSDSNLFSLFAKNNTWLPATLAWELASTNRFEKIQSFSLVEIPVVAKFSLFAFGLETDIPVFSVTDSALSGTGIPVGISRSMVDFYNIQFAGSSEMFPKVDPIFLIGQTVRLTFGASKIFPSLPNIAAPIDGTITQIGDDFPGFWLVLPESIVRAKMQEVGYPLSPPYKIVAYMKDMWDLQKVREIYRAYHPEFDRDTIAKAQEKVFFLRNVFLGISIFLISIFGIFFIVLLFSFFRERRDVFRVIYIFGLSWLRARFLTLAEPLGLLISGSLVGSFLSTLIIASLARWGTTELLGRGIAYILVPVSMEMIGFICLSLCVFFGIVIVFLEYTWRNKMLMR
jgi:hypothetical protein